MTAARADDGKYVRVYYRITDDPKFETIYGDDHHFATWVRLLLVADGIWPVAPPIPRTVRKASIAALVAAGLVDLAPKDCYRIHGLDAEREMRAHHGRKAAAVRWDSTSNAGAMRPHSTSNADPMQVRERAKDENENEQRIAKGAHDDDPAIEAYVQLVGTPTRDGMRFIDDITAQYGQEAVARAIGEAAGQDPNRGTLLSRARAICALRERAAGQQERADERQRNGAKRASVTPIRSPEPVLTVAQIDAEIDAYDREMAAARAAR